MENQHISQTEFAVQKKKNGLGLTGFIFALLAIFLGWIPFLGWIIWAAGAILSLIGVFKEPRGFAIAGLILSFIGVILFIIGFAALGLASTTM